MQAVQRTESESIISLWRLLTESFTQWLCPGGIFRQGSVWKVPADDRDATLPGNFLSIKNRLLVLQYLMSEVVSGLVPAWVWREQQWNASIRCLNEELYFKHWRSIHTFLDNGRRWQRYLTAVTINVNNNTFGKFSSFAHRKGGNIM